MINVLLAKHKRLNMSVLPTPIQRLDKISELCNTEIYCKRDDLTGFTFGGNKTRKLDYLIPEALEQKADCIISVGANQSNFCRMATGAAVTNGLDAYLVLAGLKPEKATGNLLVDHLFGAKILHIDTEENEVMAAEAAKLEQKLIKEGRKVYNVPIGGSTPTGLLGYVNAFQEILDYSEQTGIHFDTIILASGSGGTQAGLVLGKELSNSAHKIIGMSVGRSKEELTGVVYDLAVEAAKEVGGEVNFESVIVDESYFGDKYGVKTDEGKEAIDYFARMEGIMLDFVYTGKAAAAMIDYSRRGLFSAGEKVLFIHTGGNIELFE
ncbi:D-cysteine desulfhydrase family protein [Bacteroidota bacterium]